MSEKALNIPDPYHHIIQIRYEGQDIYESYYSKLVVIKFRELSITLIEAVHVESENLKEMKFDQMIMSVGYDKVLGLAVVRAMDGDVLYVAGVMGNEFDDYAYIPENQ